MPWAIVTDAGTRVIRCDSWAPGARLKMNASSGLRGVRSIGAGSLGADAAGCAATDSASAWTCGATSGCAGASVTSVGVAGSATTCASPLAASVSVEAPPIGRDPSGPTIEATEIVELVDADLATDTAAVEVAADPSSARAINQF